FGPSGAPESPRNPALKAAGFPILLSAPRALPALLVVSDFLASSSVAVAVMFGLLSSPPGGHVRVSDRSRSSTPTGGSGTGGASESGAGGGHDSSPRPRPVLWPDRGPSRM